MGRFSKRAYREGHQTLELFDHQPTLDQGTCKGDATLNTSSASGNSYRAFSKGMLQNCLGTEKCPDCSASLSAHIQNDGSNLSSGAEIESSEARASTAGKIDVQKIRIRVSDMHYGLLHTNKASIETTTTKSQIPIKTEPEELTSCWAIFDCLTDRLRRKAAEGTVLHLGRIMDLYNFENRSSFAENTESLPFVKEDQLFDLINRMKSVSGTAPTPGELSEVSNIQVSLAPTIGVPLTENQKSSKQCDNSAAAQIRVTKNARTNLAPEREECSNRGKVWANLLIQENRRMRAKWVSKTAEEIRNGQSQGAVRPGVVEEFKRIYETVKAEDEAKLRVKHTEAAFDEDHVYSPNFAVQSALPSDPNVSHEERHRELLAKSNFVNIAKKTLKAWCIGNAIPSESQNAETQYLRMIREGEDLIRHAWDSVLPPVWDAAGMHWIWQSFSKADKKEASDLQGSSKNKTVRGKTTLATQAGSKEMTDKTEDTSAAHLHDNTKAGKNHIVTLSQVGSKNEHKASVFTKGQKRAKARKKKRKAEREAGAAAAEPVTLPETPNQIEEDAEQAARGTSTHVTKTFAASSGPGSSTVTVSRNGKTYRVPAPARVDMSTAMKLASTGQLRVDMCPALSKGEAARLLKASHHFQSDVDTRNIGKDPHVLTKFLMKTGVKPSEYEQILQLNKFLEIMKRIDELGLDDSNEMKGDNNTSTTAEASAATLWNDKGKGKGTGKAKEAVVGLANPDTTSSWSSLLTNPSSPVAYPPPPQVLKRHAVIPWSLSLTPSQINSLSITDRWIALRGLLVAAHSFLSSAARLLPGGIFERLVNPASGVLKATDLPVAKYELARTIIYTKVMWTMYDKYAKAKAKSPPGTEIRDYVVDAVQDLNSRYATVEQMVGGVRAKLGRELEQKLASGKEEAEIRPGDGPSEVVELAERAVRGEEMRQSADKKAEGMVEFLAQWPMLKGVVIAQGKYVDPV